ncbi:hypothetical protein RNZ50_18185 [Paracoccaceae bacterium Fryx2]|nr:hypothetical protein [Paracoccaceae bacterium Fryx2]
MRPVLPLLALLAACGAQPSPVMTGAERVEVTRAGRSFVVFHTATRVEVIRLGYARPGEHRAIRATMVDLIPQTTGCRLVASTLQGDSGEMRGRITCPKS